MVTLVLILVLTLVLGYLPCLTAIRHFFFVKPQPVCSGGFLILPLNGAGAVRVRPESRYAKNAANGAALRKEPLPTGDAAALKSLMMLHPGAYVIKILPIWFNNGAP